MPDYTSDSDSGFDTMLGAFFGNVSQRAFGRAGSDISQRAFGRMGAGIETLENKFKQLGTVAQARMGTLRTGAERFGEAVASINRGLREQADRIRRMPRMQNPPPPQTFPTQRGMPSQPRHHSYNQPRGDDGRYLPGRGGRGRSWGWGDGGGTRFGSRFSPGGGLGGISAFGGLGSIGVLFGGASAARGFGRFDANLATLQAEAGLDAAQRKDVTGKILDIAGSTQFDTQQVSATLIAMVKDGIELTEALNQVPNVLKLAVAESTDLESAWSAMRGFVQSTNSEWSDSVRLSDMMSNATSLSAAKLRDLQDVASRGLTAHSSLEAFSTEGFLAITGILKSLNISNEVIGTGMRQFGTTIARATEGGLTDNAMAALQARGIQFERGMTEVDALKEIQAGVEGMADTELKNFFHEVFGERAKKVFENIIPKVDELAEKMELIRKKGTVNEKFEVHAKSLTNQFKLLTSAGDSLVKKFIMILNEGEGFGSSIGWVTAKITQFTGFMEANKDTIQAWWGNFKEVLSGLFNFVASGVEKVTAFWSGLSEGEKTIGALAVVIGAFVLGPVTGLIAAGALIIAKWDEIKDFFSGFFDKLDGPVTGFVTSVRDKTMNVINWIRGQWNEMSPYFEKIWDGVSFVASNAWKVIQGIALGAWEVIKVAWQPVSAFFKVIWQGVLLAAEVAWFALKNIVKGVVLAIESMWNGLKAVFNWAPVKWIRGKFAALIGFFANLVGKLKAPFESFIGFVTGIFEKIAKGIETVRGWFRRGEEGEHRLVLTVDTEQAQKEVQGVLPNVEKMAGETAKTPEPLKSVEAPKPVDAQKTIEAEKKPEYYETRAVRTPDVSGPVKPQAGLEAFFATEKDARKADEQRRIDAGLGKLEKREMRTAPTREFATDVNRRYVSTREAFGQLKADAKTLAMREDETQRFGADRESVLAKAHTFGDPFGGRRADLSRQKLFDRLEREFPKLFEKFYAPDVEKSPVIPEAVLAGDDLAFSSWTRKLTGRMERQETREKTPSTYTALGGFDKGGITADRLMNRERDKKRALEELEATRVIRFPKLDDEQYKDMSNMFRSGFLSLVDVNSAILAEIQKQTLLLGGPVDTTTPVIRPQADGGLDDEVANRLRGTQAMSGLPVEATPQPAVSEVVKIQPPVPAQPEPVKIPEKPLSETSPVVNIQPPEPTSEVVKIPESSVSEKVAPLPESREAVNIQLATPEPVKIPETSPVVNVEPLPTPAIKETTPPALPKPETDSETAGVVAKDVLVPEIRSVVDIQPPQPPQPPPLTASPEFSIDAPPASVIAGEVTLEPPPTIAPNTESVAAAPLPEPPVVPQESAQLGSEIKIEEPSARKTESIVSPTEVSTSKQPATLKDVGLPEFELSDFGLPAPSLQVEMPAPEAPIPPQLSSELAIASPEIREAVAPHLPVIHPEAHTRFEYLLENGLRDLQEKRVTRLSLSEERVEVRGDRLSGNGNITIEKMEINADSEKSAREIARAVLDELDRMLRERNFN